MENPAMLGGAPSDDQELPEFDPTVMAVLIALPDNFREAPK